MLVEEAKCTGFCHLPELGLTTVLQVNDRWTKDAGMLWLCFVEKLITSDNVHQRWCEHDARPGH